MPSHHVPCTKEFNVMSCIYLCHLGTSNTFRNKKAKRTKLIHNSEGYKASQENKALFENLELKVRSNCSREIKKGFLEEAVPSSSLMGGAIVEAERSREDMGGVWGGKANMSKVAEVTLS